jgi:hypothetical protein
MDRDIPYRRRMARVEEVISEVRHHAKCTTSCSHIERMDVNLHTCYVWALSGGELSASRSGRYMNRKGAVGGRHAPLPVCMRRILEDDRLLEYSAV